MAEVTLTIGGRHHLLQCRDGQEYAFRRLGERLDAVWPAASRAAGATTGERPMLLVALLLADQLEEHAQRPVEESDPELLARVAERLEMLAAMLEGDA